MSTVPLFAQVKKMFLKAPMVETDVTFTVDQFVDIYGVALALADIGPTIWFTFNPGGSDEEICSSTAFTRNSDGTVTFTAVTRALLGKYPYTAGGVASPHYAGTIIVVSDQPQVMQLIVAYIQSLAIAGAASSTDILSGISKLTENLGNNPRAMAALVSQQSTPGLTLKVQPFALSSLSSDIVYAGGNTSTFAAPSVNPRIDLVIYDTVNGILTTRTGAEGASPTKPTPTTGDIVLCTVFHRVGETTILERDDTVNGYIQRWYTPEIYGVSSILPPGIISPYGGRSAPNGWLICDGSAVSRSTYASLFAAICPSQTVTITNASPGVFTANSHSLLLGDLIHFTTTGGLPTGLAVNTNYYVIAAGLTTNAFQVSLAPGGVAINTSSAGSGVHTLYKSAWGKGDGASTFNIPDYRARMPIGIGQSTVTLDFTPGLVDASGNTVTVPDVLFPSQGQAVQLTTTGTLPAGLSLATTYFIFRVSATLVSFGSTQANANAGTPVVDITDQGSGVHTIVFTTVNRTLIGRAGGEETHGLSRVESPAALDQVLFFTSSGGSGSGLLVTSSGSVTSGGFGVGTVITQTNPGQGGLHNNMPPYTPGNFIIKT